MPNIVVTEKRIYLLFKLSYQIDKEIVEVMTSAYWEFLEELLAYLNQRKGNNEDCPPNGIPSINY